MHDDTFYIALTAIQSINRMFWLANDYLLFQVVAEETKLRILQQGRVGFHLLHEQLQLFQLPRVHCRLLLPLQESSLLASFFPFPSCEYYLRNAVLNNQ